MWFEIHTDSINSLNNRFDEIIDVMSHVIGQLRNVNCNGFGAGFDVIFNNIDSISVKLSTEKKKIENFRNVLKKILERYNQAEMTCMGTSIIENDFADKIMGWEEMLTHITDEEKVFVNSVAAQYGFDESAANIMYDLYNGLKDDYGADADQMFFAIMASFSYGTVDNTISGLEWGVIGRIPPIEQLPNLFEKYGIREDGYNYLKNQVQLQHLMCELDISSSEELLYVLENREHLDGTEYEKYKNTIAAIDNYIGKDVGYTFVEGGLNDANGYSLEYPDELKTILTDKYVSFCNTPDFTHMCATTSALLVNDELSSLGNMAGIYNGIFDGDKNAGYVGDIFGTQGKEPSMGNADYKSDLDAVNIAARIQNGESCMAAFSNYYNDLASGNTNRADEFLCNLGDGDRDAGLSVVYNDIQTNQQWIQNSMPDAQPNQDMAYRFLYSLAASGNDFIASGN